MEVMEFGLYRTTSEDLLRTYILGFQPITNQIFDKSTRPI